MPGLVQGTLSGAQDEDDLQLESLGYQPELRRTLNQFSAFAIQFGEIAPIGGIVFTLAVALNEVGPATIWMWVIGGILQMLIAYCVAEACSSYPVAGGAYTIVGRLLGRFWGWTTGWWLEIAHLASVAGSCVAVAPIVASWAGFDALGHWGTVLVTALLILLSTLINTVSLKVGNKFTSIGVIATLAACALVVIGLLGEMIFGSHPLNSASFLVSTGGMVHGHLFLPLVYSALLPGIVLNGFDVSGNSSEETKNASRAVPKGMVRANGISFVFGTLIILLLLLVATDLPKALGATQPVTAILDPVLGHVVAKTFEVLAVYGLYLSAVVLQMAGARVLWAQARDGDLPAARHLHRLNRESVPATAVWVGGVVAFLMVLWSSLYAVLVAMTIVLWVAAYGLLIGGMWVGKRRGVVPPAAYSVRGWKVLFPLAVIWSTFLAFFLIYQNPVQVGVGLAIVVAIGLLIYFFALPKGASTRAPQPRAAQPAEKLTTQTTGGEA